MKRTLLGMYDESQSDYLKSADYVESASRWWIEDEDALADGPAVVDPLTGGLEGYRPDPDIIAAMDSLRGIPVELYDQLIDEMTDEELGL